MPQDFYAQRARPLALLFLIAGILGLAATWLWVTNWFAIAIASVAFGVFVVFGVPAVLAGGQYRSWFEDGRFCWTYPSRFYGRNDSCAVGDVVEFQHVYPGGGVDGGSGSDYIQLALRDGTKKYVSPDCVGFQNYDRLYQELQKDNPSILYVRVDE
jgi:hypothetical protein